MVSQRQRLARKKFKESHPELFPTPEPTPPKNPGKNKKRFKPKRGESNKGPKTLNNPNKNPFRKHPLRVPGMQPGASCFICKAKDHIAKLCPQKAQWEKNKICLLCRQRGHSLKNCPNKTNEANEKKFCYNCGEAGHSLSKCSRPLQDGGTKFANCFICNEHGHLSKDCPKNKHGIYPKGGSCKICGGITHLARDCPNKGNRNSIAASGVGKMIGGEYMGRPRVTKLISGDDLDDDFTAEDANNSNKGTSSESKAHFSTSLEVDVEKDSPVQSKKKKGPKVVNFQG